MLDQDFKSLQYKIFDHYKKGKLLHPLFISDRKKLFEKNLKVIGVQANFIQNLNHYRAIVCIVKTNFKKIIGVFTSVKEGSNIKPFLFIKEDP